MISLMQGDCLELLRSVPDNSVDLVVTDPPYLFENRHGGGAFGDMKQAYHHELDNANIVSGFNADVLDELRRVMKAVNIYTWCNKAQIKMYLDYFADCNMDIITWHKTNPIPACSNTYLKDTEYCLFFRQKGVKVYGTYDTKRKWYATPLNVEDKKLYGHPTIKPLNIIENLVVNSSVEGDTVLDPFMGSGTTGVACRNLNRNFIGMEIDETYFKLAESRINDVQAQIRMDISV